MKVETTSGDGGAGAVAAKRRQREAAGGRSGSGVTVRRRRRTIRGRVVQADAAARQAPLRRLLAACRLAFGPPGTVPAPADASLVKGMLDKVSLEDVHLSAEHKFPEAHTDGSGRQRHPIITRTTMYSRRNFSIVVFVLPQGAVIPLHNHPGMTVFSKLLRGSMRLTSYDWAGPPNAMVPGSTTDDRPSRLAKLVLDADLNAPCDALVLHPESGGNMHRFAAATPSVLIDVLGPPYSQKRDCTYYHDFPCSNNDPNDTGDVDAADEKKARLAWLKETGKPKNLKMYEVPYRGPPIF